MKRKKIAVIGTGISGMATAYCLCKNNDVIIYEKNAVPGGHTRTKHIVYDGDEISVDTGFIVFNKKNYPELTQLFDHLVIPIQKSDMSFGFTMDQGNFEWGSRNLNGLFGQRSNLWNARFYKMLWNAHSFFNRTKNLSIEDGMSLGAFLKSIHAGQDFIDQFLLPMGAAIWSCPSSQMMKFPAASFIQFFKNHGLLSFTDHPQWYTVAGGSEQYLHKLIQLYKDQIRLNCPVQGVEVIDEQVYVYTTDAAPEIYDDVVFACHGDEAFSMLQDKNSLEKEILGSFTYQKNMAYLHKDIALMPKRKACWSSWIYMSRTVNDSMDVSVTYWMNNLQKINPCKPVFLTLNPLHEIDSKLIFDAHEFYHPVFDQRAMDAQKMFPKIQGKRHLWFCGAYQQYGFHEDGIASAVRVVQGMGESVPWHKS